MAIELCVEKYVRDARDAELLAKEKPYTTEFTLQSIIYTLNMRVIKREFIENDLKYWNKEAHVWNDTEEPIPAKVDLYV